MTPEECADYNNGLIPQLVSDLRRYIVRPMLSFSSIFYFFQKVRLKFKKLSQCYMSETVMELLSSVKIIGMSQCKHFVSFKGDFINMQCTIPNAIEGKCRVSLSRKGPNICSQLLAMFRSSLGHMKALLIVSQKI